MFRFHLPRTATRNPALADALGEPQRSPPAVPDVVGLAHLWAMQFQHITTLAFGGGGGLLVLTQTELVSVSGRWWVSLVLFAVAAVGSMIGQVQVVEEATRGKVPSTGARAMVAVAMLCFGGSAYLMVQLMLAG